MGTKSDTPFAGPGGPRRTIGWIETAEGLDRAANVLKPVALRIRKGKLRTDVLTGRHLGHPVHPAAVSVPLGCWTASGILDMVGGPGARRASQLLVGAGSLAAGPAVVSGLADWLDTEGAEKRIGVAHAIGNLFALSLFTGSWVARRRGRTGLGVLLGAAGSAAVSAAGFLGGHLAYVRGVGVNTTAFASGPRDWTSVEHDTLDRIANPAGGVAGNVAVVIVADPDAPVSYRVLEDRCTHRGAPLHEGRVEKHCIVCPWHGSKFDIATGTVQGGPASVDQPVYEVREVVGQLQVRRTEHGDLRKNPVTPHSISLKHPV